MTSILKKRLLLSSACALILAIPQTLEAQEESDMELAQAEAEMVEALGKVPSFFEAYPEHARASAWKWWGDMSGPEGVIPGKYVQLIALAVAAQIPCDYCTFGHTAFATQFMGATEEELRHAVAIAADVRHWSTVLNGANVDPEEFKVELNSIIEHIKAKSAEASATTE